MRQRAKSRCLEAIRLQSTLQPVLTGIHSHDLFSTHWTVYPQQKASLDGSFTCRPAVQQSEHCRQYMVSAPMARW